jgi:hypothetical protein
MKHTISAFAVLAALLATGVPARAGISWSYDFTPSTTVIWSDNHKSSLTLTNQASYNAVGSSDVIATQIGANSTTLPDSNPDIFTHANYTLKLKLTDAASGMSTFRTFTADISGSVSMHSTNTTNTFHSPTSFMGIHLGHNIYDIFIGPYTGPGPGGALSGSIGAHINVHPEQGGGGPPPHGTPEPTSLVLAGMGAVGLLALRRRRVA